MIRRLLAFALVSAAVSACETTSPAREPVIAPMTDVEFSAALESAKANPNPYSGEQKLTELIESKAIGEAQRGEALYARATHRWKKSTDKAGAKADFEKYLKLFPEGAFTKTATYEVLYVEAEIAEAETRLLTLQTLRAWFDDTWAIGQRDAAAARYRRSGLTPEPHQVYALRSTGYLCQGTGNSKLHNYGALTSDIQDLYWCK